MTTTVTDLPEGEHQVDLDVRDTAGGATEHTWSFRVDKTTPGFTITTSDESGATNVSGWTAHPVTIKGEADDRGGSPAKVQWSAEGFIPWTDLDPEGLTLPEGFLYSLSFRAIDTAGNVAGSKTMQLGWDATPPNVSVDPPPRWWRSQPSRR
jgi:hypothetical protein